MVTIPIRKLGVIWDDNEWDHFAMILILVCWWDDRNQSTEHVFIMGICDLVRYVYKSNWVFSYESSLNLSSVFREAWNIIPWSYQEESVKENSRSYGQDVIIRHSMGIAYWLQVEIYKLQGTNLYSFCSFHIRVQFFCF